jgi:hypothetical protein
MTTCIESKKSITTNGYSRIRVNGKQIQAHRWVWELLNGKIEEGKVIDHTCSNRKCIAIDHLRVVTQSENILAGKHSVDNKTHCKKGHSYPENLSIRKSGKRECAECNRVRARKA